MKVMQVNTNVSFPALMGLMQRANTNERLRIADEWMRENKVITVEQYRKLLAVWTTMVEAYGVWKIVVSCGRVHHDYMSGLTHKEALRICAESHWRHNHNNGCVWDMEIEWEG